jgi:type IV pilus assembly protein PilF
MGKNAVALDNLKKAVDVDSGSSDAHAVIAVLYDKLGEVELAERHFKKAIAVDSANAGAQNNYGLFLCKKGKVDEAIDHFRVAYEDPLNSKKWLALSNAGDCALKNQRLDQASELLRSALKIHPRLPAALLSMAKIKYWKGNFLSARAYLQRFREVSQHTAETLWLGIQVEHELGQQDAVASYTLTLRVKFPDSEELNKLEERYPQYR